MWYLSEGALFQIFGTHDIEENASMQCPFRCGRGKIEYNPAIIDGLSDEKLELYLKAEVIRILLKHPYERQPDGCRRTSMSLGSNLVLADNYDFGKIELPKPEEFNLPKEESYEWYSFQIEQQEKAKEKTDQQKKQKEGKSDKGNTSNMPSDENKNSDSDGDSSEENHPEGTDDKKDSHGDQMPSDENKNSDSDGDSSKGNHPEGTGDKKDSHGDQMIGSQEGDESLSGFDEIQLPDGTILKLPKSGDGKRTSVSAESQKTERQEETRDFSGQSNQEDLSQLWEEDTLRSCEIDVAIDEIAASNSWGSLAGKISGKILANTKAKIDYRKVLSGFRASVLSTKRHLTRMRPNRRSGFDNMGSIRRFKTNILVAVDVSGSVDDKSLSHFFSIVNRAFKYGIENIDVLQFDTKLKDVVQFDKAQKEIHILGRGGTSFQPVFDFVAKHPEYDGLLIFTDGYAPKPKLPKNMRCKVAWICNTQRSYNENKGWMLKIGRCCPIQI